MKGVGFALRMRDAKKWGDGAPASGIAVRASASSFTWPVLFDAAFLFAKKFSIPVRSQAKKVERSGFRTDSRISSSVLLALIPHPLKSGTTGWEFQSP